MKAMVMTAFGGPEVLEMQEVPEPEPGPGDILVEVHAAAVNPVDCKTRQAPRWGDRAPPMILGFDVSGVVRAVGGDVKDFAAGDEVFAAPALIRDGSCAELVLVDARTAAKKPASLSHVQAAAIPLAGLTAWESLHHHGQIADGDTVLITAGAGGVGHLAIQLARYHGCTVLTTAGRAESMELCESMGAHHVINYRAEDVVARVRELTGDTGCQLCCDFVGGEVFNQCIEALGVNGRVVTIVPGVPGDAINSLFGKNGSLHFEFMGSAVMNNHHPEDQGRILRDLAGLVESGDLRPYIDHEYALEDLAEAHQQQESQRTLGKLVVRVRRES